MSERFKAPFVVNEFTCATNTRIFIAVKDSDPAITLANPLKEAQTSSIFGWLSRAAMPDHDFQIARMTLVEFCGSPIEPEQIKCPKCKGSGEVQHSCDCNLCTESTEPCKECNEKGEVTSIPHRPRWIAKVLFNVNYIARALKELPFEANLSVDKISSASKDGKDGKAILISCPSWWIALQGLDTKHCPTDKLPTGSNAIDLFAEEMAKK